MSPAYMGIQADSGKVFGWFSTWFVVVILGPTFHFHLSPDIHRGVDDLVRHRIHVSALLRWREGAGPRPQQASVLVEATALRRVVSSSPPSSCVSSVVADRSDQERPLRCHLDRTAPLRNTTTSGGDEGIHAA